MMLSSSQRELIQTKGVVIGRVLIGLLFLSGGLSMLLMQGPAGVADYFGSLGLPMPVVVAWLVIILKIVAGGMIVIGRNVGLASAALIVFTIGTIFVAHFDLADTQLFKNLAIVGGLLYVMAFGAGNLNSK